MMYTLNLKSVLFTRAPFIVVNATDQQPRAYAQSYTNPILYRRRAIYLFSLLEY